MQIEKKVEIIFRWWNDSDDIISPEHVERLEEHALDRIAEIQKEGYTSGELIEEIDDISYSGWWKMSMSTL